jgi:uncharacterized protein with PIN domain
MTLDPTGKRPMPNRATVMLRIVAFATPLLISSAPASRAGTSYCGQASELAAARQRWDATRQSHVDRGHHEKNCRAYGIHFYEAVMARQAVSICGDGRNHQRNLDLLDSEIDAFNNLIATQCSNSR